jgi:hypothetical protein
MGTDDLDVWARFPAKGESASSGGLSVKTYGGAKAYEKYSKVSGRTEHMSLGDARGGVEGPRSVGEGRVRGSWV